VLEIVSVKSDDWNAIYVNGEKLVEHHSINWEWFLTYKLREYELTENAVEKVLKCSYPEKVSEFPKKLHIV